MNLLLKLFIFLYLIYDIIILIYLYHLLNRKLKYFQKEDKNIEERFKPNHRYDVMKWNHKEIYFCAIFIFPFRFIGVWIVFANLYIILKLISFGYNGTFYSQKRKIVQQFILKIACRIQLFLMGNFKVQEKYVKIQDFFPQYKICNQSCPFYGKRSPITIANHVCFIDGLVMIPKGSSFLCKEELRQYPFFGSICENMQNLFVTRQDRKSKDNIIEKIMERSKIILSNQENFIHDLAIFPEGTTTNNKYIMPFKKGAFYPMVPIKLLGIKYENKNFNPAIDALGEIIPTIIMFLQLKNSVTVYNFDYPLCPVSLGLNIQEKEINWKNYAEIARDILSQCVGLQKCDTVWQDKIDYYNYIQEQMNQKY